MKAGATGTVAAVKAAYAFTGAATSSRFQFRVAGAPASPATGTPSYKGFNLGTTDFASPNVLFLFDVLPVRTAP